MSPTSYLTAPPRAKLSKGTSNAPLSQGALGTFLKKDFWCTVGRFAKHPSFWAAEFHAWLFRSERSFGRRDPLPPLIERCCFVQGPAQGFENRFQNVVGIITVRNLDM